MEWNFLQFRKDSITMSIQEEVLLYLKQHSMKKKGFAEMIDVSPAMLSHWFRGRVRFNKQKLDKIMSIIEAN